MYLNPKTKEKIKKITKAAFDEFGGELTELSNYKEILIKENAKLPQKMSRLTMNKWWGYMTMCIHNLRTEAIKEKQRIEKEFQMAQPTHLFNNIAKKEMGQVKEMTKMLSYSINFYSDGTFERIEPVVMAVKEEEVIPPVLYLGLFDYNDNKVIIQKGGYKGCNVKNKQSILSYFRTMKRFEEWCVEKMEDVFSGRLKPNPDTPIDMTTLNKIINEIEIKRRLGSI